MAKFIKFDIRNSGNGVDATSGARYVNVDDIESVTDVIGGGPGYAVQIVLKGLTGAGIQSANNVNYGADAAQGILAVTSEMSARVITLLVQTDVTIAAGANSADPGAITVEGNMPSVAVRKAMSANPGGVVATAQLGLDGGGVRGTDSQMYWNSFAIANTSPAPAAS
tara:strand:- start:19 stop:519 length:501 start_codon:yes stop_codon:yes gene_type:complete